MRTVPAARPVTWAEHRRKRIDRMERQAVVSLPLHAALFIVAFVFLILVG